MDVRKSTSTGRTRQELEQAMHVLAGTIREAGECLLDLEQAMETLHLANQPGLAREVKEQAAVCLRRAMQR
jgi:hypothetical protein